MQYSRMMPKKATNSLRRYATIGSVIDTLRHRRVAFVDPENWDDKNDAGYMRIFKEARNLINIKALCCTESPETYHHWKVFTTSSDGCFIDFFKDKFLASIESNDSYFYAPMEYVLLDEMRG